MGGFQGSKDWCANAAHAMLVGGEIDGKAVTGRLSNLDQIDALTDTERVKHVKQHQLRLHRCCAATKPHYLSQVSYWDRGSHGHTPHGRHTDTRANLAHAQIRPPIQTHTYTRASM